MKLLLADDHSLFRDTLVQSIERAEPEAKIELAGNVHEVMEIMSGNSDFDLVLLDWRMPGMNGVQGLEKVRKSYPDVPVALLSGLAEKEDVRKAMASGAAGYLPKTLTMRALISGIKEIIKGEPYVATDHNTNEIMPSYYNDAFSDANDGMQEPAQATLNRDVHLTKRENEVLQYLLKGYPNKEIARELGLQVVTVKLHVRGICRKLSAGNRTHAALIAREMGL
jgi:two-component system, NarL family, nitrate/nitrite response regulator NarL